MFGFRDDSAGEKFLEYRNNIQMLSDIQAELEVRDAMTVVDKTREVWIEGVGAKEIGQAEFESLHESHTGVMKSGEWFFYTKDEMTLPECEFSGQPVYDDIESGFDPVDRPAHYNQGGIECIDAIESMVTGMDSFEAYCAGNAVKYIWRAAHKGQKEQDIKKAIWYLNRLLGEKA
jgi:hypothetical protein